jgi:CubicO group peptidase (beta-lactamase class C family)
MPFAVVACVCGSGLAFAQADIPADLQNRPPVAAPTSKIEVNTIPVVRSESQEVRDFTTGLITGLTNAYDVKGLAIAAVEGDHVMFVRGFGRSGPDSVFALGNLADVFAAVAAMQQVERTKILLNEDVSRALDESSQRNVTADELLTGAVRDPGLLQQLIAKSTGMDFRASVETAILKPLGMTATGFGAVGLQTSANDMTHLMIALVNGGTYADNTILQPETVDLMERTHRSLAPALPGWTYGFAEMRRGGWRALQHDGEVRGPDGTQTRLVIVPEAKIAYFVAVSGGAPAAFWRRLDDALFDEIAMPRANAVAAADAAAPPNPTDARRAAGIYVPAGSPETRMAGLKRGADRIRLRARVDGALIVSGARTGVLAPQPGGIWSTEDGSLMAAIVDGQFVFGGDAYRGLAVWKTPEFYAWLALIGALATVAVVAYQWRTRRPPGFPSDLMLGVASASVLLLIVSVLVYLLAPFGA